MSAVRGRRLAQPSMEIDRGGHVERCAHAYLCPAGHERLVPMHPDAEPPATWDCRCGREARLQGHDGPLEPLEPLPPAMPSWDPEWHMAMLRKRRTPEQGEALLAEAVARLRGKR